VSREVIVESREKDILLVSPSLLFPPVKGGREEKDSLLSPPLRGGGKGAGDINAI
jgi:hypothetical protein